MGVETKLYDKYVTADVVKFIQDNPLDEGFDHVNSRYYAVCRNGDLVGVVVYGEAVGFPRFLHIIIDKKYRRSRAAYQMLGDSERELHRLGFPRITCFIRNNLPNRDMKRRYALHWGYRKYAETKDGEFFLKDIGG